jgi:hypothetical protein
MHSSDARTVEAHALFGVYRWRPKKSVDAFCGLRSFRCLARASSATTWPTWAMRSASHVAPHEMT